jgi:hypothetical protein
MSGERKSTPKGLIRGKFPIIGVFKEFLLGIPSHSTQWYKCMATSSSTARP